MPLRGLQGWAFPLYLAVLVLEFALQVEESGG